MKTCVFINGTNCVGKTTLAKELITHYGGIATVSKTLTVCKDERICFAGRYDFSRRFGGVDGFSCTKILADVVQEALQQHEVIICEGCYFHTIGLNLTNAMFKAEKHLVVHLYAPLIVLNARLIERGGKPLTPFMANRQGHCREAARKWRAMGVPVLVYDTSQNTPPQYCYRGNQQNRATMWRTYDSKIAKEICYGCGSPVSKAAYNYFRTAMHYSPDKVWTELYGDHALYFATRAKTHVRLIEIAVRSEYQGRGLGKKVLFRLLSRMKWAGLYKLTFRTPIVEEAQYFWLHNGARIVGIKGEDYEMELTIKKE